MATRPSRSRANNSTDAGTTTPPQESPVAKKETQAIPAAWGAEPIEEFAGHDLTEKKELVGVPFLIIGAEIERNENRQYDVAYVYAVDVHGTEFEFSDSSTTGVRAQIQGLLADKGLNPAPGGGFQKLRVAVMKGLRVSEFKFVDPETQKRRDASVFYLTGSGRHAANEEAAQTA